MLFSLNAGQLPVNTDPNVDGAASTDFSAFELPQMIIKQSWLKAEGRFRAAIVESTEAIGGILCSDSYVSACSAGGDRSLLELICLVLNSNFATYYQLMTSGRFAAFIPQPLEAELRAIPLPDPEPHVLGGVHSFEDVDSKTVDLYRLKAVEKILIDDMFNFTLPDFKGDADSPGQSRPQGAREKIPTCVHTASRSSGSCKGVLALTNNLPHRCSRKQATLGFRSAW